MIKNKYLKMLVLVLLITFSLGLSNIGLSTTKADVITYTMTEVSDGQAIDNSNEITISSKEELNLFANYVNSGNNVEGITFKLVSNIDLQGSETNLFTPIGTIDYVFNGNFDGQNHTISNLYISGEDYVALFSYTQYATIENINIDKATIIGNETVASVGAESEFTTYKNITVKDSTIVGKMYVGGVVGYIRSSIDQGLAVIENVSFNGIVKGVYSLGGIVGHAVSNDLRFPSTMINCKNFAEIDYSLKMEDYSGYGIPEKIGGICGYGYNAKFTKCENFGNIVISNGENIVQDSEIVGGIVGKLENEGIIEYSKNYGKIYGVNYIGGIAGYNDGYNISINFCENNGDVYGTHFVGGLVGKSETDILNSKNTGNIYTQGSYSYRKDSETNQYIKYQTDYDKTAYHIGGICGVMEGDIYSTENLGSLTVNNELISQNIGGICGEMSGDIKNTFNKGSIYAKAINVGGLCGSLQPKIKFNSKYEDRDNDGDYEYIIYYDTIESFAGIYNSYATCKIISIESLDNVGGLVGYNRDGSLVNCYYVGILEGTTKNNIVGKLEIDENVAINIPNTMYTLISASQEDTNETRITILFENASTTIKNLYYENNNLKAINNLDNQENFILGLTMSQICSNEEDSLSEKLNEYVQNNKGYKFWKYEQDYPVLYTKVFKVNYDFNGGIGNLVDTNDYLVNDVVTINFESLPTRQNYTFVGYILNEDSQNLFMPYDDVEDTFVILQEINILKAVWKLNEIENIIYPQEQTYDYVEGLTRSVYVLGQNETDKITYSIDGITYREENFSYEKPGEYTIFFKIERENYEDYFGKSKITINKINLDISNAVWIREWFEDYIQIHRQEVIENNEFRYNSYENTIVLNESNLPREITKIDYGKNKIKNSGTYTITATLDFDSSIYNCEKYLKIDLKVNKIVVNKPTLKGETTFEYDTLEQFINIDNDVENDKYYYSVLNNSAILVGKYNVVAQLKDKLNYVWSDNTTTDMNFSFEITPKLLAKPSLSETEDKTKLVVNYDEQNHILEFFKLSNELVVLNNTERKNVGKYEVSVILKDTLNYNWVDNSTNPLVYSLEIKPKEISIPTGAIGLNDNITEYEHIFTFNNSIQGVEISSTTDYIVSNNGAISAGSYKALITLLDKHNTVWLGGKTEDLVIPYLINKIKITKPVNQNRFIYNGLEQTFELTQNNNYIVSNNKRTLSGEQIVVVSLIDKNNTCWSDESVQDLLLNFVIEKAKMPTIDSLLITKELVKGKVITNLQELIMTGAKLTYSLAVDGEYVEEIEIKKDGEYTIYYKVEKENYETISGQFKIVKESEAMIFGNLDAILLYVVIIFLVIVVLGAVYIIFVKKAKISEIFNKNKNLKQVVKEENELTNKIEEEKNIEVENKKQDNEKLKAHYDEELLMLEEKFKSESKQKNVAKKSTTKKEKVEENTKLNENKEESAKKTQKQQTKQDNKNEDVEKTNKENVEKTTKSTTTKQKTNTEKSSSQNSKSTSKKTTQTKDEEKPKTSTKSTTKKEKVEDKTNLNENKEVDKAKKTNSKTTSTKPKTTKKESEKQENKD